MPGSLVTLRHVLEADDFETANELASLPQSSSIEVVYPFVEMLLLREYLIQVQS